LLDPGNDHGMQTFVGVYLALGFLVGFGLLGWAFVSSVRRHGFAGTMRGAAREYLRELSLYWSVPVAAWLFLVALPVIAAWAILQGDLDVLGLVSLALLWLLSLALLRWHRQAKARARSSTHSRQRAGSTDVP
jgi:hypothetical protein